MEQLFHQFIQDLNQTTWYEFIAAIAGIASVWFSKKENIWVYPIGLINTVMYIFISVNGRLFGEASVNFYYTVMSIYGWILWAKKDHVKNRHTLQITYSTGRDWLHQFLFFAGFYAAIYFSLSWLKDAFAPQAIPWADAFASSTAYTGMWLMAKKKIESWYWWIATNMASIPLYFVKHYVFTSVQFLVLLILAVAGLIEWMEKRKQHVMSIYKFNNSRIN